jgi:hypothetical protein
MAKKDKEEKSTEEQGPPVRVGDPRLNVKPEVEMKEKAFGVTQVEGQWSVIELLYDVESKQAKVVNINKKGTKTAAIEQFKITVARSKIIG